MAGQCFAPTFEGHGAFTCIIMGLIYLLAIAAIIIATLGLCLAFDSCRCIIKQYQFRISHCRRGNSDPAIPL